MSYALTKCNADVIGFYRTAEAAKLAVPCVSQWQQDQYRIAWNGWMADAPPYSPPDYQVIYMGSSHGGFTWQERAETGAKTPGAACTDGQPDRRS